jgi:hypothetical protein
MNQVYKQDYIVNFNAIAIPSAVLLALVYSQFLKDILPVAGPSQVIASS